MASDSGIVRALLLIAYLLITEVVGQESPTCVQPLAQYSICVQNSTASIVRETVPLIVQIDRCLNISKCSASSTNQTTQRTQPQGLFRNVNIGKLWKCADNASQDCWNRTQDCVVQQLPEWNDTKKFQEQAAILIKQPFSYINNVKSRLRDLCSTKKAQDSANACIDMAIRRIKLPSAEIVQQGISKLCKVKTDCQSQLSEECQKRLQEIQQVGCQCFQKALPVSGDQFFECLESPVISNLRRLLDVSPYFGKGASIDFCNTFDPCSTNSTGQPSGLLSRAVGAWTGIVQALARGVQQIQV